MWRALPTDDNVQKYGIHAGLIKYYIHAGLAHAGLAIVIDAGRLAIVIDAGLAIVAGRVRKGEEGMEKTERDSDM